MTVIGCVDPGTVTGWVKLDTGRWSVAGGGSVGAMRYVREMAADGMVSVGTWDSKECIDWDGGRGGRFGEVGVMWEFERWCVGIDVLVIEDFILRRSERSRDLLAPVRLGAMMEKEWVAGRGRHGPVVWQSPADKSIYSDAQLRSAGLWIGGARGGHIMDAVRHLCLWLARGGLG